MLKIGKAAFLLVAVVLSSCGGSKDAKQCATKESCVSDPNCFCWCSQVCEYRKKEASDHPRYITDDSNGKFCYCKQWDYDNYKDNCLMKKHIKEPPNAQ